ncbi:MULTISPECIES: YrdB family protein [unclassified Frankia]
MPVTVGLPVAVATLWGVFATAGAQASGRTVVETPGPVRLLLELTVLGGAALALYMARARRPALVVAVLLLVLLAITHDRRVVAGDALAPLRPSEPGLRPSVHPSAPRATTHVRIYPRAYPPPCVSTRACPRIHVDAVHKPSMTGTSRTST